MLYGQCVTPVMGIVIRLGFSSFVRQDDCNHSEILGEFEQLQGRENFSKVFSEIFGNAIIPLDKVDR